jgi:hypothetical protein
MKCCAASANPLVSVIAASATTHAAAMGAMRVHGPMLLREIAAAWSCCSALQTVLPTASHCVRLLVHLTKWVHVNVEPDIAQV